MKEAMKVVSVGAALVSFATAFAGATVGYREIGGTNVVSGTETQEGVLRMDPSATYLKTGAGTLELPSAGVDARAPWSVDVLGGTLKLSGAGVAPAAGTAPAAMQKALVWLDASALAAGDLPTWSDCRANGYVAVAKQLRADPVAPPVVTTVDGVKCVDFGGLSDKYMRFQKDAADTTLTGVQHWFFVYGFKNVSSAFLGYEAQTPRGAGLMATFGVNSVVSSFDDTKSSPYFQYSRVDMVQRDIEARHWVDGVRIDPFTTRPKKGFQLFEGDQQQNAQDFQTIFFRKSELYNKSTSRTGGNYVCEVVVFACPLTEAERLDVERYLMAKWSLPRMQSTKGDEPRELATGEMRVADGASVAVSVPAASESLPLAFSGKGDVVKSGEGTLVVGPSGARPHQGGFSLEGGDVLLRGGSLPAIVAKGGETWNSTVYPGGNLTKQITVEECNNSGFRVTKTAGAAADVFTKSGSGEVAVSEVKDSVKVVAANGILRLAAREGGAAPDTGIEKTSVTISNASFEDPYDFSDPVELRQYLLRTTWKNSWYGIAEFHSFGNPPCKTWSSYPTPCGDSVLKFDASQGGFAWTDVTFPRAGTYELFLYATSRFSDQRRNCLDVSYNGKKIGYVQVTAGPFARFSFRFDVPAEDAGTSHTLMFNSRYTGTDFDAATLIDGLEIHPVAAPEVGVFKVPNGDFNRRDRASDNTTKTTFSRAMKMEGWTLSLTGSPAYTDAKNGYIAFCSGGCPAGTIGFYPYQELTCGTGVLGFFDQYGRATTAEFTLPAGRWLLRGSLARWDLYLEGTLSGGWAGSPLVGAWLVRGGTQESLGTITTIRHSMGRFCWPKVIEVAEPTTVQLIVGNTNTAGGVLDDLEFVPADVAAGDENLVLDPGCEKADQWTKIATAPYKDGDSSRFANVQSGVWNWGCNAFDGDYCLRIHASGGMSTSVTFPVAGLYRLKFHARPRPDSAPQPNPVRAFLRFGDGSELEIFRQKRLNVFWRYAEYSALFEIPADRLPADGKVQLCFVGQAKSNEDRTTFVDGVSIVKVDPATVSAPAIPETTIVSVEGNAQLHLDYPGVKTVQKLFLGGVRKPRGVYNAANCPEYITGMGSLAVEPLPGTMIIVR